MVVYAIEVAWRDINEMKYTILRTFKKVKEYFGDHPEFDVSFPDVDWPV